MTATFLDALPADWKESPLRIDSRLHMLMKDWLPCIGGWHHDDVPRDREDGQPDYVNLRYKTDHCMAIWGDASLTEFAVGKTAFPDVPLGQKFYKDWHPLVDEKIANGQMKSVIAPERKLIFFDWQSFHQGKPAKKDGWRFFIRATRGSQEKPHNQIRHQTQVYMKDPNSGW